MDEHSQMLECECSEADRLSFVCLSCGEVYLWDPSWFVIAGAVLLFSWNLYAWVNL